MLIRIFIVCCLGSILQLKVNGSVLKEYEENIPERRSFLVIAKGCGYDAEEHEVITEDGYILTVHHIPGDGEPILLQHGILDSSDGFILRENKSIVMALANNSYDLWFGNFRGNRYSRRHQSLSPDENKFWDFSLDEIGYFDLAAIIDFILLKTNRKQLAAIGHSEGTSVYFVLGSRKPEYNEKIKVMIALAPIAYLAHVKPPIDTLVKISPLVNEIVLLHGKEELMSDQSALNHLLTIICSSLPFLVEICSGTVFTIVGADPEEVNPEYLKLMATYYPTGTSRRNFNHFAQISTSGRYQRYDYGCKENIEKYGTGTPPEYDLSNVTMPVALIVGVNDKLSTIKDALQLNNSLPNSILRVVPNDKMNHIDFLHGDHMEQYLFPLLFEAFNKYL